MHSYMTNAPKQFPDISPLPKYNTGFLTITRTLELKEIQRDSNP